MDIDILIVRRGPDMENTKLDMKALFSPNGGVAPFAKTQGKSPMASLQTQSTSFVSVLDEKTFEAINNKSDTEANNEEPDQEAINPAFAAIPEVIQSQPSEDASVAEALGVKNQVHQVVTQAADGTGQVVKIGENSTHFKLSSASGTEEKAIAEIDQSTPIPTLELTGMSTRNNVKSDIPFITENRGQVDDTQTHTIVNEAGSKTLAATVVDASLSQMDSSVGDHATNHMQSKKSMPRTEAESRNEGSEVLRQKDDMSAVDTLFTALRRTTVSHRDNRTDTTGQKEAGALPTATQEPSVTADDRAAAIEASQSRKTAQVELSDHAVFMKNSPEGITADDQDVQQHLDVAPDHHDRTKNQYEFPLRAETTNILSGNGNRLAAADGSVGINTQAVIDQIQNARQSMNSGFGRVRITLDPPNLGTVSLEIVVRKEWVGVVMTADNSGVQQALQSRVDDIRTALQRQDLKIENFQILLQDNTANQQRGYSGAAFGQQHERQAGKNQMENHIPVEPLTLPIEESRRAMGLVSIFV